MRSIVELSVVAAAILFALVNLIPSTVDVESPSPNYRADTETHYGWPARWLAGRWIADEAVVKRTIRDNGAGNGVAVHTDVVTEGDRRSLQSQKFGFAALALDFAFAVLCVAGLVLVGMAFERKRGRWVAVLATVAVSACIAGLFLIADRLDVHL